MNKAILCFLCLIMLAIVSCNGGSSSSDPAADTTKDIITIPKGVAK